MKLDIEGAELDLQKLWRSVPGNHVALSLLGSIPGVMGLFGLTLRKPLKRRLLEELSGNDEALQLLHWVTVPENALVLVAVAVLMSVPMMRSVLAASRQQLLAKPRP